MTNSEQQYRATISWEIVAEDEDAALDEWISLKRSGALPGETWSLEDAEGETITEVTIE